MKPKNIAKNHRFFQIIAGQSFRLIRIFSAYLYQNP